MVVALKYSRLIDAKVSRIFHFSAVKNNRDFLQIFKFPDQQNRIIVFFIYKNIPVDTSIAAGRVKDNCLYSDIQALNFKEFYKKNVTINRLSQNARITVVMSKISEDSNPVIIKVKLKR